MERAYPAPGDKIPDRYLAVLHSQSQPIPVGGEDHAPHLVGRAGRQKVYSLAILQIEEAEILAGGCQDGLPWMKCERGPFAARRNGKEMNSLTSRNVRDLNVFIAS